MEKHIEAATVRALEKMGYICPKMYGTKGIPDRLCIGPGGRVFFVEFKDGYNVASPIQLAYHKKLRDRGIVVLVAYTKNEVLEYARSLNDA